MTNLEKHAKELNNLIAENKALLESVKELEAKLLYIKNNAIKWDNVPKGVLSIGFNKRTNESVWVCEGYNSFNYMIIYMSSKYQHGNYMSHDDFHKYYTRFPMEKN